ncbi:MAG: thrombospondin type 3 repeat-containing protein [Patescibacteria group bacterium]
MKRTLKLFLLLGGIALFTVGCQLPFTKKTVTLPLLEKSPAKVAQLNKEKTAAITTSHIEMTADITGRNTSTAATGDMSGTITLKADTDVPSKKMQGSLTGTISASNASYNFGLDLRSLNDVAYLRLTTLPTLPGAASNVFSDITNVWYRLDPTELQNSISDTLGGITSLTPGISGTNINTNGNINSTTNSNANLNLNAALNTNAQEEILERITDVAKNANIYSLGDRLADEKVNNVNCYHYKILINSTEIRKLLTDIMGAEGDLFQGFSGFGGTTVDQSAAIDEAMKILDDMNGEIWIGKKDYYTHKVTINLTTTQETQILTVRVSLVSSNFNQPVTVEAPADSKSFTELMQTVMAIFFGTLPSDTNTDSTDVWVGPTSDERQIENIEAVQTALSLYHGKNGEYPDRLSDVTLMLQNGCPNIITGGFACDVYTSFRTRDVFNNQTYTYTKTGDTYTLKYQLTVPPSSEYQAGENTLTPDSPVNDDADRDGLNSENELLYGTESNKADTDGDGYSDGIEVFDGYNPLGQGVLTNTSL